MEQAILTYASIAIIACCLLIWLHTKSGKRFLEELKE